MTQPLVNNCETFLLPGHDYIKSIYTVAEWNVNGWISTKKTYNFEFKTNVIQFLHADFLILPEIHCLPDQKIEIANYT